MNMSYKKHYCTCVGSVRKSKSHSVNVTVWCGAGVVVLAERCSFLPP